jgi:hypothetical protein
LLPDWPVQHAGGARVPLTKGFPLTRREKTHCCNKIHTGPFSLDSQIQSETTDFGKLNHTDSGMNSGPLPAPRRIQVRGRSSPDSTRRAPQHGNAAAKVAGHPSDQPELGKIQNKLSHHTVTSDCSSVETFPPDKHRCRRRAFPPDGLNGPRFLTVGQQTTKTKCLA